MVTFRNNNRRQNFRRNDRNFKRNGENSKYKSNFANTDNFQRKVPGRNNHNASKLVEKYNDLAREALSSGDKILSENYFQHADHFMRILADQENLKSLRLAESQKQSKIEVVSNNNQQTEPNNTKTDSDNNKEIK